MNFIVELDPSFFILVGLLFGGIFMSLIYIFFEGVEKKRKKKREFLRKLTPTDRLKYYEADEYD